MGSKVKTAKPKAFKVLKLLLLVVIIAIFIIIVFLFFKTTHKASRENVSMTSCNNDNDCILENKDYKSNEPTCCIDASSPDVIAFNEKWWSSYKEAHSVRQVCNMACMNLPNARRYKAQCIEHTCQKVFH